MARATRDLERTQRLLRLLDLEEVLEEGLGLAVLDRKGADLYFACPDPGHKDRNPSFHVCVEDVLDDEGRCRLGWFHCWSHPEDALRGLDLLDLVARVREGVWGEGDDDRPRWPTEEQRTRARAWLRETYVRGAGADERAHRRNLVREARSEVRALEATGELVWPPGPPIESARAPFRDYLRRRGFSLERAAQLDVRAVSVPGDRLSRAIGGTCPGVLFPIYWEGRAANWFLRAIEPDVDPKHKGRYCPGTRLHRAGILWAPDGVRPDVPTALVEGIFDAERVRRVVLAHGLDHQVVAVLGGRLVPEQARSLRGVRELIHVADGDAGGETLAETIKREMGPWCEVRSESMPPGRDPGDAEEADVLRALTPRPRPRTTVRFRLRRSR